MSDIKFSPKHHALPLTVLGLIIGAICVFIAKYFDWMPDAASREADRVDSLIWFCIWTSIVVYTVVMTFLLYSVWRFRAKPGDERDGYPNHGHTVLEIVWTLIPTIVIAGVAVWAAVVVVKNENIATAADGKGPLHIDVAAQQFWWEFTYPELGVSSGELRIPADRQVVLKLHSRDVIHSFFVPETRIKGDAVPGITNSLVRFTMKPETAGTTYPIICTELCGAGHGIMRSTLRVMSPTDYDAWATEAKASVKG